MGKPSFVTGESIRRRDAGLHHESLLQHEGDLACWQGAPVAPGPVLVTRADVLDEQERYFATRSDAAAQRDHAAVDAEALLYAFINKHSAASSTI
jgi:hypothetical protein